MDETFERKEEEERERVLYVAMTRARERRVSSGAPSGPFMEMILPHREKATVRGCAAKAPKRRARPKAGARPFDPAALEEAWRARESVEAGPPLVSPSSLVEKRVHLGDYDEPVRRDACAAVGTVVHAALAALDYAAPSAEVAALARRYGPGVEREARDILTAFFPPPPAARLASAGNRRR